MDPRNERPQETDLKDADELKPEDVQTDATPAEPASFKDRDPDLAPEPKGRKETERELDHGLKETFPASDPVSINPGAD